MTAGRPLELADGQWRALAITCLAVVLSLTTWFSATAVIPEMTRVWNLEITQAGWLTNAVQLGFVIGALVSSVLAISDTLPLTRLLAGSALLAAAANAVLLLEPAFGVAIASRFLTGAALAGVYPPALKFIATWFKRGRGLAMGAMVGALTLGSAMPHLIRATGSMLPWQMVVLVSSVACLCAAAVFASALHEGPYQFSRARFDPGQIGLILINRPVMLANLGYFGHMWELYAMWGWILAFTTQAASEASWGMNVSVLAFAAVAMGAPGCVVGGLLADRIGRCNTTAIMMTVSGLCALCIGFLFSGPFWIFTLLVLVWGFTVVADSAQFSAAVSELSDASFVGSSLAFQMGVGFAITIFTIWATPVFAQWLGGWQWSFLLLVPGPIVGVAAMLALKATPEAKRIAEGLK